MVNNHFTLKALADEIRDDVNGSVVESCSTSVVETLDLVLARPGGERRALVVSCRPRNNHMFMRAAPRRNAGANVLHAAVGAVVNAISAVPNERTVLIELSNEKSVAINLFGPHANVLIIDKDGEPTDTFLKRKSQFRLSAVASNIALPEMSAGEFTSAFSAAAGNNIRKLVSVLPSFAGTLAREAFFRLGLKPSDGGADQLTNDAVVRLYAEVKTMLAELSHPSPRVYYDGDNPVLMSIIEMRHLGPMRSETYSSVNMSISVYSSKSERKGSTAEIKRGFVDGLEERRDELRKIIAKISEDLSADRESRYRRQGDTIMAHLSEIDKGASSFTDGETGDSIRLDPVMNAVQNAQAYYEKAKKARESCRLALVRRESMIKSLVQVEAELARVEHEEDGERLASTARVAKAKEKGQTQFREFETSGFKVFVGKDARNNDQLTFGFAKPNDVFLHARGVSGSHVIIRNSSREYPQKSVLEFAARLAAYYSRARTSGIVPVTYTMRKFVKKAKGTPGAVLVDREEVIFVKPGLPQAIR